MPASSAPRAHTGPTHAATTPLRLKASRSGRRGRPSAASANRLVTAGAAVKVTAWRRPSMAAWASRSAGPGRPA